MMMSSLVRFEKQNTVGVITLNNPPLNLNQLGTITQLREICGIISVDRSIRVVVVTGSGDRAFCVGSDIKEFTDVLDDVVPKKLLKENEAFSALEALPQPVIGALNGTVLGGGLEIALACDIRILSDTAKIGFPEINLGVFPGSGGVFRLTRAVGQPKALELLMTGRQISSQTAECLGLVNECVPAEQVLTRSMELASELSNKPALALSIIKRAVRESATQNIDEATFCTLRDSNTVFAGPDIEEGIQAFFEKRVPEFRAPRP